MTDGQKESITITKGIMTITEIYLSPGNYAQSFIVVLSTHKSLYFNVFHQSNIVNKD